MFAVVRALRGRRTGVELFAYREARQWRDVRSSDINRYLKELAGGDYSAKDFRTWHATVLAAVALAVSSQALRTRTARQRAITRATAEVAHYLGNAPAVARRSYIDPRVIDRFSSGVTISVATMLVDDAFGGDTRMQMALGNTQSSISCMEISILPSSSDCHRGTTLVRWDPLCRGGCGSALY